MINTVAEVSLIALTSLYTNIPCEDVFVAAARKEIPAKRLQQETPFLRKLAVESCKTSNPDIVWQIAKVETNFNFTILRINHDARVHQGETAVNYLRLLKKSGRRVNLDIGAMQLNWYWHRQWFNNDPIKMMDPAMQVRYLVTKLSPSLKKHCRNEWVGCYHNPANGKRARIYNRANRVARKRLERAVLRILATKTNPMPPLKPLVLSQKQIIRIYDVARNARYQVVLTYLPPKHLLAMFEKPVRRSELKFRMH